jgi:lipoprotein-releasing system ATP-binding protein
LKPSESAEDAFAIRAEGLRKSYRSGGNEVLVFEGLTFQVRKGERLAVVGESGAGKSTLLHLLGGLDRATSGEVWIGGSNLSQLSEKALADLRNREIGFVWQSSSLLPEFTALENVMMPLLVRGDKPAAARAAALEPLTELGLQDRRHHRAGELSGGEQQRVALARALVVKPNVLLADEPTGSLDYRTGESVIEQLTAAHRQHSLTSIYVTHNISFAIRCDRVLELKKGTLQPPSALEGWGAGVGRDATRLDGGTYV